MSINKWKHLGRSVNKHRLVMNGMRQELEKFYEHKAIGTRGISGAKGELHKSRQQFFFSCCFVKVAKSAKRGEKPGNC